MALSHDQDVCVFDKRARSKAIRNLSERVNAVAPGVTETPLIGKMGLPPEVVEAFGADVQDKTPAGRLGQPRDIANVVAFLASAESSYVNGAKFAVDGGFAQV